MSVLTSVFFRVVKTSDSKVNHRKRYCQGIELISLVPFIKRKQILFNLVNKTKQASKIQPEILK